MDEGKKLLTDAAAAANIEMAISHLGNEARIADFVASIRKLHYDASIKKGFTPEQSLVLCQSRSLT
jgi:hypothetical protein